MESLPPLISDSGPSDSAVFDRRYSSVHFGPSSQQVTGLDAFSSESTVLNEFPATSLKSLAGPIGTMCGNEGTTNSYIRGLNNLLNDYVGKTLSIGRVLQEVPLFFGQQDSPIKAALTDTLFLGLET